MIPGPRNLLTDVPGLLVGNASDPRLKSGVTVVLGEEPVLAGVHVMGGAPGTRETDLLAPDRLVDTVDALVLSGGSAFGLDAASGVADSLRTMGRGFVVGPTRVPIVPAAILFDLLNGGDKDWPQNPYRALGAQAIAAVSTDFALGTSGAGTGATTATLKGGLGSASIRFESGITVAALAAVNALGSATVGDGPHFWAAPWEEMNEFGGLGAATTYPKDPPATKRGPAQNTTLAIVATDVPLTKADCTRLATAAHDGMARALVPSHTPFDGDLVFALSTGRSRATADPILLCHAAATCLARAIARGVYLASEEPGDLLPTWSTKYG